MSSIRQLLKNNNGFAIGTILIVVVLIGLIAGGLALAGKHVAENVHIDQAATQLVAQANLIRQKITHCVVEYPEGDNGTGTSVQYPSGNNIEVSTLTCPGAPVGSNNLWTGVDGTFLPPQPTGFTSWKYTNDAGGVKIVIQTSIANTYAPAMNKALAKFNTNEALVSGDVFTVFVKK